MWVKNVYGAKLLHDMFNEFSESRVTFDKVEHGKKLTDWIIENVPQDLIEVAELIKKVLSDRNT